MVSASHGKEFESDNLPIIHMRKVCLNNWPSSSSNSNNKSSDRRSNKSAAAAKSSLGFAQARLRRQKRKPICCCPRAGIRRRRRRRRHPRTSCCFLVVHIECRRAKHICRQPDNNALTRLNWAFTSLSLSLWRWRLSIEPLMNGARNKLLAVKCKCVLDS